MVLSLKRVTGITVMIELDKYVKTTNHFNT